MNHNCPITGCKGKRGGLQLMCRDHWFAVPEPIRTQVYAANEKRRNRATGADAEHMKACRAAIREARKVQVLAEAEVTNER